MLSIFYSFQKLRHDNKCFVFQNLRHDNKSLRQSMEDQNKEFICITRQNAIYEQQINILKQAVQSRENLPENYTESMKNIIIDRDELQIALDEAQNTIKTLQKLDIDGEIIIGRPVSEEEGGTEDNTETWRKLGSKIDNKKNALKWYFSLN